MKIYKLSPEFKKQLRKIGIIAVYLFGSRARGKVGVLSDYDIGVLLKNNVPDKKFFDIKLKLIQDFSLFFKTQHVDVVVLNKTTPLLAINIINEGYLLFDAMHEQRIDFETKATMKYLDRLPYERHRLNYLMASKRCC